MPKTASILTLKTALKRERRTNRRLRTLIEELRKQVQTNRRDLDLQFARLSQIQVELDALKRPRQRAS